MNQVLSGLPFARYYINDVIIFSKTHDQDFMLDGWKICLYTLIPFLPQFNTMMVNFWLVTEC